MYTALLLFGFFIFKKKGIGKDWPKKINKLSIPCSSLRQADINLLEREDARRLHWAPVLIGSELRSYPHDSSHVVGSRYIRCFAARDGDGIKSKFPQVDDDCVDILDGDSSAWGDSLSSRRSEADRVMCSGWAMFWFWLMFGWHEAF